MAKFSSPETKRAVALLAEMLRAAKLENDCKNNDELARLIQPYVRTSIEISGQNIQAYTGTNPNLPDIEKLDAIASFFGKTLDEFFVILFNPKSLDIAPKVEKDKPKVSLLLAEISKYPVQDKIYLHRIINEDIYRSAS